MVMQLVAKFFLPALFKNRAISDPTIERARCARNIPQACCMEGVKFPKIRCVEPCCVQAIQYFGDDACVIYSDLLLQGGPGLVPNFGKLFIVLSCHPQSSVEFGAYVASRVNQTSQIHKAVLYAY